MRFRLSKEASRELEEAKAYYESQQEGLGSRFEETLYDYFSKIVDDPFLYPAVNEYVRRAVVQTFPYLVYYLIDTQSDSIVVVAISHQHRKPKFS
jgi:plasmid stabilization system protein ParE